jgi:hypothetical protein
VPVGHGDQRQQRAERLAVAQVLGAAVGQRHRGAHDERRELGDLRRRAGHLAPCDDGGARAGAEAQPAVGPALEVVADVGGNGRLGRGDHRLAGHQRIDRTLDRREAPVEAVDLSRPQRPVGRDLEAGIEHHETIGPLRRAQRGLGDDPAAEAVPDPRDALDAQLVERLQDVVDVGRDVPRRLAQRRAVAA